MAIAAIWLKFLNSLCTCITSMIVEDSILQTSNYSNPFLLLLLWALCQSSMMYSNYFQQLQPHLPILCIPFKWSFILGHLPMIHDIREERECAKDAHNAMYDAPLHMMGCYCWSALCQVVVAKGQDAEGASIPLYNFHAGLTIVQLPCNEACEGVFIMTGSEGAGEGGVSGLNRYCLPLCDYKDSLLITIA